MYRDYYNNEDIRSRLDEFLGASCLKEATAMFVSSAGENAERWYDPRPVGDLWKIAAGGAEIARSLWDRTHLIAHLDVEYVNFDDPSEPYLHPARAFDLQRPVIQAIQQILLKFGIAPLHILSGRGHHLVWSIPQGSAEFAQLAQIGRLPSTVLGKYSQSLPPTGDSVRPELGRAFAGLGMVLEHLAHLVLKSADPNCLLPVELTAVEVGPKRRGREIISIDLSEYGDPLHTRTTRMPFSIYRKPQHLHAGNAGNSLQPLFSIPLFELDERQGLAVMRDADEVVKLARCASVQIPDQSEGTAHLLDAYKSSELAAFHDYYYSVEHDAPDRWPSTYDQTPLDTLPGCTRRLLRQPNDMLLKPAGFQHVTRSLMAWGWHPRHIAGLIRSKFERDYGWGPVWFTYDAALRADFYTRVFSGLFTVGLDPLIDFNCKSTQEKGYCCTSGCGHILEDHRLRLLARKRTLGDALGARSIHSKHC